MSKLKAFVRLDFKTVKPYLTIKNLLIFAAVALFLSAINGTVEMSLGIGFMLGTIFISYPFAVGEKSNMDALYTTLSVKRKTVVLGRYLFVLLFNAFCLAFSFVFAAVGVLGARAAGAFQNSGGDTLPIILAFSGIMILMQAVQLPIYFKLGYARAKFVSTIPFAVFIAGYFAFMSVAQDSEVMAKVSASLANVLNNRALFAVIAVLVLALAISVSYCLSLSAYRKREF